MKEITNLYEFSVSKQILIDEIFSYPNSFLVQVNEGKATLQVKAFGGWVSVQEYTENKIDYFSSRSSADFRFLIENGAKVALLKSV